MPQQINLLKLQGFSDAPGELLQAKSIFQALGIVTLIFVAFTGLKEYENQALNAKARVIQRQLQDKRAEITREKKRLTPPDKDASLGDQIRILETQVNSYNEVLAILAKTEKAGTDKNFSEYMRAISRKIVPGMWLSKFYVNTLNKDMLFQGKTTQAEFVSQFIKSLTTEPVMHQQRFEVLKIVDPTETEKDSRSVLTSSEGLEKRPLANYRDFTLQAKAPVEPGKEKNNNTAVFN